MKFLEKTMVFIGLYIVFMIPTYYLPKMGSTGNYEVSTINGTESLFVPEYAFLHFIIMLILVIIVFYRAKFINKKWLISLPIIALIFDVVPVFNMIPFITTIMHVLTLALGANKNKNLKPE